MNLVGTNNESTRTQWITQKIKNVPAGWRLLDAGAGEQRFKQYCDHLDYVSQDFAEYNPKEREVGLHPDQWDHGQLDIISDVTKIPEEDESFDMILCSEVLEHLSDPLAALREFSRLLRPGRQLLLTAPFVSLTHFAPYHFCTGFNRFFYELHLKKCGFEIDELSCNGNFFELLAQELRRVRTVAHQYTGSKVRYLEKQAIKIVLSMLSRLSTQDKGSSELACFGLQVEATRCPKISQDMSLD